ncbi:hypothetical protein D3C85_1630480 [compost metagenome]
MARKHPKHENRRGNKRIKEIRFWFALRRLRYQQHADKQAECLHDGNRAAKGHDSIVAINAQERRRPVISAGVVSQKIANRDFA